MNAERAEMLDRLMAKTLPEFKDNQTPEENEFGDEDPDVVDISAINNEDKDILNG